MSTTRWRPELTTVKMLYTAESPAQPTKLKLPNLTFTEPNLSYQTYKNQYTLLNPTKSKQRNQTFAKHTYWTIPFKRNRLSQIYSVQFQELKHSKHRKNCECCPGHYLIVSHFSSMSGFKFRNLSVIVNCVTKSLIHKIALNLNLNLNRCLCS